MPTRRGPKPKPFTIPKRLLDRRRVGKVTLREMAQACGVSKSTIWQKLARLGFPHRSVRGFAPNVERRRQAAALRAQGLTLGEIGQRLGITRQRAHQLLKPLEGKR